MTTLLNDDEDLVPLEIEPKRSLEEEIIFSAISNHEPLPMLDVIFSRVAGSVSPRLKSSNGFLSETTAQPLVYETWNRSLSQFDANSTVMIANTSWGGPIVLALDPGFLHAAIAVMLGGKPEPENAPARMATVLEQAFAQRLFEQLIDELKTHISRIVEVSFTPEPIESPLQVMSLLADSAQVARANLAIDVAGTPGLITILLPLETLEPARNELGKMFLGEKLGGDRSWRDHFEGQISSAAMQVEVEMARVDVPLADILQWRPGVTVDLGVTMDQEAVLRCSGIAILNGVTGRKRNGRMALRITGEYSDAAEKADDGLIID